MRGRGRYGGLDLGCTEKARRRGAGPQTLVLAPTAGRADHRDSRRGGLETGPGFRSYASGNGSVRCSKDGSIQLRLDRVDRPGTIDRAGCGPAVHSAGACARCGRRLAGLGDHRNPGGQTVRHHEQRGPIPVSGRRPGRYLLIASGLGYTAADTALFVTENTTVQLILEIAPVRLDSLEVRVRDATVRGVVREKSSGVALMGVDVTAPPDRWARTDGIGRFKFGKLPSGIPFDLSVRMFGYLPVEMSIVPEGDTTLNVAMAEDPVAARMIAAQIETLDQRSAGRRYRTTPVLDRKDLLKYLNGSISEVVQMKIGRSMHSRIRCIVVDDQPQSAVSRQLYFTMPPDHFERVEILEYPGMQRALMVRLYTREFGSGDGAWTGQFDLSRCSDVQ